MVVKSRLLLVCGLHACSESISCPTHSTSTVVFRCCSSTVTSHPLSSEPNFVSSYDIGNFTYFFFRENAVERDCGRMVFSRAGRVCKNDIGGRFLLEDTWTTFMKARLNCSRPGEIPFNYNELQGTFYLPELELLYGIFTTNVWVTCTFLKSSHSDILEVLCAPTMFSV